MNTTDTRTAQLDSLRADITAAAGADEQADRIHSTDMHGGHPGARHLQAMVEAQQDAHGRIAETLEAMTTSHDEARAIIDSLGYEVGTRERRNARQGLDLFRVWEMG